MGDQYRVVAQNTVGDTYNYANPNLNEIVNGGFPTITATAISEVLTVTGAPPAIPADPSGLTATLQAGPQVSLTWMDNATDETGFVIERSDNLGPFVQIALAPAFAGTGIVPPYVDTTVLAGNTYDYRVAAVNAGGPSLNYATLAAPVTIPGLQGPTAPDQLEAVYEPQPPDPVTPMIHLQWADNSLDETGFMIERSTDGGAFSVLATAVANVTNVATYDDLAVSGGYTYTYRVAAFNANGTSAWTDWTLPTASATVPADATPPAAPSNLSATNVLQTTLTLNWLDNSNNELGFTIQRATNSGFTKNLVSINVGANVSFSDIIGLKRNTKYFFRVQAVNGFNGGLGPFPWSPSFNVTTPR
jgi:predicted phage tail protein